MKVFVFVVALLVLLFLPNYFRWGYDDTDDYRSGAFFGRRSGLSVYTDHLTGAQYVKAGLFGGITPRIDKDGKPMFVK